MPSGSQTALRPPIPSQSTSPLALHRKTPDISASTSRSIVLGEDEGEEDEDEDTDVDADEEGVLWDAQTALIAHQSDLAMQLYTTAALPPHKSSRACLALGNLLTRGSGIKAVPMTPTDESKTFNFAPTSQSPDSAPTTPLESPSIMTKITGYFGWPSVSVPPRLMEEPKPQVRRLLGDSWSIPKEGKRAQRDVQGMGVAAGWLLLGLAWIIEGELDLRIKSAEEELASTPSPKHQREDSSAVVFSAKGKAKAQAGPVPGEDAARVTSGSSSESNDASSTNLMSSSGSGSETAPTSQTTREFGGEHKRAEALARTHQLIYDLLRPLLHLYRHGQIQAHDPVFLPPIPQVDLPPLLKGSGDLAKGRNAYTLGGVIAKSLLDRLPKADPTSPDETEPKSRRLIHAIRIMSCYVLGMTVPDQEKPDYFATIIDIGHCQLAGADDLIEPASQRLESLTNKSRGASAFISKQNARNRQAGHGHRRINSTRSEHTRIRRNTSLVSFTSSFAAGIQPSPIRSATSSTSVVSDLHPVRAVSDGNALNTLRRLNQPSSVSLQRQGHEHYEQNVDELPSPALPLVAEPETLESNLARPEKPKLRHTRSSPVLYAHHPLVRAAQDSRTSSAFLTPEQANIAPIDRALAEAELASALTKQVKCSVCGAEGVNFPECRKCGLHFCSRECRIGVQGAGDGKRHHCGLLEEPKRIPSDVDVQPVPATPPITVH